jgi:magnesium-transporting ATPase (P-type)
MINVFSLSFSSSSAQRLKSLQEMRSMSQKPYDILVYRNCHWKTVKTDQLIPGDICSVGKDATLFTFYHINEF